MGKAKNNISNWSSYNHALVSRGSVTFWIGDKVVSQWHCDTHHGGRGRGFHFFDTAIETALMLETVFLLPLRATEGFLNSIFDLMQLPCHSPDYSCLSKRAKTVEVDYKRRSSGAVAHVAIDSDTHTIIAAQMSLESEGDNQALPALLNPLRRKIN